MDYPQKYIDKTFQLAKKGKGQVSPNPLVGALIVKNGKIISTGYHAKYGEAHAERSAILKLAKKNKNIVKNCAQGADIYISLEPCNHHGKTPPCTDIIIEAGIKNVYFSVRDPNPKVKEKDSVKILEAAGIKVHYDILKEQGYDLNKVFFTNIEKKRPYFILKTATSLDGKICDYQGNSKWISGPAARTIVHELRYECNAVLTGINTVLKDDPALTVRLPDKHKEIYRVILDTTGKIALNSQVITNKDQRTIVVVGQNIKKEKLNKLSSLPHIIVLQTAVNKNKQIDLKKLSKTLYKKFNICSVLIEAGGTVNESFIKEKLVDEYYWFIAPKIIGGAKALTAVSGPGFNLRNSPGLTINSVEKIGDDLLLKGKANN